MSQTEEIALDAETMELLARAEREGVDIVEVLRQFFETQ
jgi:hypothetical protein